MPSGARGGGSRGSHSGGSGSFGKGSHRGGISSSRSYYSNYNGVRTRIYIMGGRRYVLPQHYSKIVSILAIFIPILFFIGFFGFGLLLSGKSGKDNIETDYVYYNKMITKAEKDARYVREAEITGIYFHPDWNKWYYTYEFETDSGYVSEGWTFSVYDDEHIEKFDEGQIIEIAVDDIEVDMFTNSIPMDFKNISIEQDGEYQASQRYYNIGVAVLSICAGGLITLIVISNRILKKHKEEVKENGSGGFEPVIQKPVRCCEYCGSELKDNEKSCSSCGAKSTKFKL